MERPDLMALQPICELKDWQPVDPIEGTRPLPGLRLRRHTGKVYRVVSTVSTGYGAYAAEDILKSEETGKCITLTRPELIKFILGDDALEVKIVNGVTKEWEDEDKPAKEKTRPLLLRL